MSELEDKFKVYTVVLGTLTAGVDQACCSCICTENVLVIFKKRLSKLKLDLSELKIDKEEKTKALAKVNGMIEIADKLPIKAETSECLMTKGVCKLQKCIYGCVSEILNLIKL
ncbi:MAG: hypothetical protein ABIH76_04050 [Candidatus Bathyarchaeota archaeon]